MENTLIHADIFFVISSIGFCILFILLAVLMGYVIAFLRTVERLGRKIEEDASVISEEARAFIEDLRESTLFRLFIRRKKRSK